MKRFLPLIIWLSGSVVAYPLLKADISVHGRYTVGDRLGVLAVSVGASWIAVIGLEASKVFSHIDLDAPAKW